MTGKKARLEGEAVAILVLVIALFMVLYILFIPPTERAELLGEELEEVEPLTKEKIELLAVSPGKVSPEKEFGTTHSIPSVNIFLKTEPEITDLATSLTVLRSWVSKSYPTLNFNIENLNNLKSSSVFFSIDRSTGKLRLTLNNQIVFEEEVERGAKIIDLPKNLLKENNKLTFETSFPIAFWNVNENVLREIGLKKEFELVNAQEKRFFTIPSEEKQDLEEVKLNYFQVCNKPLGEKTTSFQIYLNKDKVHSAQIKCINIGQTIELDKNKITAGSNELLFVIEEGDFSFNEVSLETFSAKKENPSYYFTLSPSQHKAVRDNTRDANLKLTFKDSDKSKNARILINSGEIFMKTTSNTFEQNIDDYLEEGTNFLRIIPSNTFDITSLKITLE